LLRAHRLIIIIAAPVMIGLTMDYDMFIITKIFELRQHGYSTRFAVLSGTFQSGSIITTAGLVMVIAFVSLCLSQIAALRHMGFLLVVRWRSLCLSV
jgi:predicted RND superfamily exporter protein